MSLPALEGWFSPSVRRNRKSFILAVIALIVVAVGSLMIISWFSETSAGMALWLWAFVIPSVICTYFLTAQRLRDLNVSGWLALLWIPINALDKSTAGYTIAPVVLFLLSIIPGTKGPNNYGPDPLVEVPSTF
jgi:uncharacterized membrane protein YhaH (DUF805 family)